MPKKATAKPKAMALKSSVKEINKVEKKLKKETKETKAKPAPKKIDSKVKSIPVVAVSQSASAPATPKKVRIPIPPGLTGEAQKLALKWRQLFEKTQGEPSPYKMSGHYEAKTPIKHKVLGWGYVLSANNSRIEVLFQDGVKTLITDLKE